MSDEETICEWLEKKPALDGLISISYKGDYRSPGGFWQVDEYDTRWHAIDLTLDRLHEVEDRLTDVGWYNYLEILTNGRIDNLRHVFDVEDAKSLVHATAAEKIAALATVIRGEGK